MKASEECDSINHYKCDFDIGWKNNFISIHRRGNEVLHENLSFFSLDKVS